MIRSKGPVIVVVAVLSTLLAAAAQRVQAINVLSGRDLLRVIRDKEARGRIPAYESRLREKTNLQEPTTSEESAGPEELSSPPGPVNPERLLSPEELAGPEEFSGPQAPKTSQEPAAPMVSTISAEASETPAADELLQMIPAESMFCVRVNNFDFTLSQIDQFLAGISPMPMGVSILMRTQLAKMLGSPELNGVKMGGSFAVFGPLLNSDMSDLDNIGILVPVTDYKQFVAGNPNVSEPDETGISRITSEGAPPMLVAQVKGYALISPEGNDNELIATAKSISASGAPALPAALDAGDVEQAVEQPIWAYANIQQASKTFGPVLLARIEEIKTMMESMKASGRGPTGDPSAIMNIYALILETLMKQTRSLSIAISPKPEVVTITESITAVPGTDMASLFVADESAAQENRLMAYLQDGAVMNFAGKMNTPFWKELNLKSADFYAAIGGGNTSAEDTAKMKKLAEDVVSSLGGPVALSFLTDAKSRPPLAFKYILEVKDADKLNSIIAEAVDMMNTGPIADFYRNMGMELNYTVKRGVDSYKGASIDSATLLIKPTDTNSPQAQMITAMYGGGLDYRWAMVNGLCVCAAGGDVDNTIRELITQAQAGPPTQMPTEIRSAVALLPEAAKADFLVTFNYLRLFQMITAIIPFPMPQMDIPTKSNIVCAGKAGGGRLTVDVALPKEHLTEIMGVFQRMMQQRTTMQRRATMQPREDMGPVTKTKVSLMLLHNAVIRFKMDTGRYPTKEEGLHALVERPRYVTNYPPGGYLETTDVLKDAWGNDFVYELYSESGKPFVIISYGADGAEGGEGQNADLHSGEN